MNLARLFGTKFPLIQAPMAGAQDERLALAVSAAGGLGSLPAAMLDADTLRTKLQVLQGSGLPYNVNFFCHQHAPLSPAASQAWQTALAPYYAQYGLNPNTPAASASRHPFDAHMAEVLEAFHPTVVSFHFGLPDKGLLAAVKARGAFILSSATTVREALWLQAHGADGIIVQGLEAGGHRGHFLDKDVGLQSPSLDLLVAVAKQISLPLLAAGGIAQATDVAEAMALGASGVQAGTAFLLCDEALTGPLHRARLRDVAAPTELTNVFTGGLARGLVNRALQELGPVNAYAPPFPYATGAMLPLRTQAESLGQDAFTPLWSGTNRSGCMEGSASQVVMALSCGFA
jgi:nitronate monooxygenase